MQNNVPITQNTIKRLLKDIKDIKNNSLETNGIYYKHSDDDILKGYALIIGQKNTPYEHGFYFFDIKYPCNYPHSPPTFKYCTNDGFTRFNPNLYIDGKVCLSILNTWSGEQWSACQTISTILLTICTILNDKPLLNEPGISETHRDFNNYNKIITYKNFDTAICNYFETINFNNKYSFFHSIIKNYFMENYNNIIENIKNNTIDKTRINLSIYNMSTFINYQNLLQRLETIYFSLKN
tara:strand:- start:1227 stop:1940 length:714 start_codon:yes stop_codon:yes gene_type:complete